MFNNASEFFWLSISLVSCHEVVVVVEVVTGKCSCDLQTPKLVQQSSLTPKLGPKLGRMEMRGNIFNDFTSADGLSVES